MVAAARSARLTTRLTTVVAGGLALVTITAVVTSLLVWVARGMVTLPVSFGHSPVGVLGLVVSPICYAAVGGILAARRATNPIGWLFLAIAVALGTMLPVNLMVAAAHETLRPASAFVTWAAWGRTAFGTPVVLTGALVAVFVFPDGRSPRGAWSWGIWIGAMGGGLLAVTSALDPVGLITYPSIANPLALPYAARDLLTALRFGAVVALVLAAVLALASLAIRYRQGNEILRAQLRWILAAVLVVLAAGIPFAVVRYVLRVSDSVGEMTAAAAQISACAFPLAAAFAISRHRLWEVDMVIGRTLVYLPLMAALGGMYTAGIALFQRVFVALTGSESDAAVVMTILVVASIFTPLRHALETTVDRRFPATHAGHAPRTDPYPGRPVGTTASMPERSVPFASGPPTRVRLLPVGPAGQVACPLAPGKTIVDCLRCSRLIATAAEPEVTVVCEPGQPPPPPTEGRGPA